MRFTDGETISLIFKDDVLNHFEMHRQNDGKAAEAGGQLFAEYNKGEIVISGATGPNKDDKRGRFFFWPNRKTERLEITGNHENGLHFVGDWHTHPEAVPTPSDKDLQSMRDCYQQSRHALKYFVMVIVGIRPFPEGLSVSVHNDSKSVFLERV